MLYLKCFDAEVSPEIAQSFASLSHLSPTDCTRYLLKQILTTTDESVVLQQIERLLTMMSAFGYQVDLAPGMGYMVFCELIMGSDPAVMRIALDEMHSRWHNTNIPEVLSECLGAMAIICSYIHFQIKDRGMKWNIGTKSGLRGVASPPRGNITKS